MSIRQRPVEQFDSALPERQRLDSAQTLGLGRQQIACRAIVEDGISRDR